MKLSYETKRDLLADCSVEELQRILNERRQQDVLDDINGLGKFYNINFTLLSLEYAKHGQVHFKHDGKALCATHFSRSDIHCLIKRLQEIETLMV